jgi:hypothetical protein
MLKRKITVCRIWEPEIQKLDRQKGKKCDRNEDSNRESVGKRYREKNNNILFMTFTLKCRIEAKAAQEKEEGERLRTIYSDNLFTLSFAFKTCFFKGRQWLQLVIPFKYIEIKVF